MTDYTSVKVPKVLAEDVEKVADEHGYRSVSEFVLDCVRRRLEWTEWYSYPMRLKYLDVCNVIGCHAYAIEVNREKLKKTNHSYWLPLCKKHLLEQERAG